MSIAARLPSMTLPELTRLHDNAVRLAEGAPGKQRDQALELLPLLEAEIAARRDGKKRTVDKPERPDGPRAEKVAKERAPRAPKPPRPQKTASQQADDFLAGVNEAISRR
ncbi:MAG: hypothetical protein QM698_03285 [Micropepsaceae bacterium]